MKLRNWITLTMIVSAPMLAMACGGKDKGGDGDGDSGGDGDGGSSAGSTSEEFDTSDLKKEIDDLRDLIAELEDQLNNASEQEIPDLQDELDAALDRLNDLETCQNGGSCEGVETVGALTALTGAYCDWVFGCCTDDEARATLGRAASDADGCKDMLGQLILRGGSTPTLPGFLGQYSEAGALGELAARVQSGRISLDADKLEQCAETYAEMDCADVKHPTAQACEGEPGESGCENFVIGHQDESEPCSYDEDCMEGLHCSGVSGGTKDGVCLPEPQLDDFCQEEDDCMNMDGDLYCDEEVGRCQMKSDLDEDCEFSDPTFNALSPTELTVPCLPGLFCSLETSTCINVCDGLDVGDTCMIGGTECGEDKYCDPGELDDQANAGACAEKRNPGATSDADAGADSCKSGALYDGTLCAGDAGEACDEDEWAGADCNSGSCNDETCRAKCEVDSECESNEHCVNEVCYESVQAGGACVVSEQCPEVEYCDVGGTDQCAERSDDGDCTDDDGDHLSDMCLEGHACVSTDEGLKCRAFGGAGTDEYCSEWYHCSSGRCELYAALVADNNLCKNASGLGEEGDDCDFGPIISQLEDDATGTMDDALYNINNDPCGRGLFCKRSAPNSTDDFSGTCTEQLEPGAICDLSQNGGVLQCAGNLTCAQSPTTGLQTCQVPYSEPDQHTSCVLGSSTFATDVAYGNFVVPVSEPAL